MIKKLLNKVSSNPLFKRFGFNFFAYGYSQVVTLLIQFIQVPFFLKYWGAEKYGQWIVLTGIPMILALLDFGISQASATRGTIESSGGRWEAAKTVFQTALVTTSIVGGIAFLLGSLSLLVIDWKETLHLTLLTRSEVVAIMISMSGYLAIQLQGGCAEAWFRISDNSPLGAFVLANRRVLDLMVYIVILCSGGGAAVLAISLFGAQLTAIIGIYFLAGRVSRYPMFGFSHASRVELRGMIKPSLAYLGFPLAQVMTLQGSVQLLNQVSSPRTVVAFTMCRTLVRIIIQLAVVANNALKPELSRLAGKGKHDEMKSFAKKVSFYACLLGVILYASVVVGGPWLLEVWSKGIVHVSRTTLALIGMHAVMNVFWYVNAALKISVNKHENIAWSYFVVSAFSLIGWIYFNKVLPEILGASLLLAIPELFMLIYTNLPKKVVEQARATKTVA